MSLLKQVDLFRIQPVEQRSRLHSGGCLSRKNVQGSRRSCIHVKCTYSQPGPQQQPEPDFNDISGLSDLADISTDPDAPRFVPTFSRVARRGFAKRYELFPGGPIDTSTDQEPQENGLPNVPEEIMDLPKGPTHKEMIAARRHYLKRQARRGLLPPSRPIRKRFPLDDSF